MNGLRLTASTDDARVARVIFRLIIAMPMRPGKKTEACGSRTGATVAKNSLTQRPLRIARRVAE
jgi:hypothetical protein